MYIFIFKEYNMLPTYAITSHFTVKVACSSFYCKKNYVANVHCSSYWFPLGEPVASLPAYSIERNGVLVMMMNKIFVYQVKLQL